MSIKLEAYKPKISKRAQNLAEEFDYLPYMVERYLSMFGPEETLEFLNANEQFSSLSFRTNTLKSSPQDLKTALVAKGYALKQSEHVPVSYTHLRAHET